MAARTRVCMHRNMQGTFCLFSCCHVLPSLAAFADLGVLGGPGFFGGGGGFTFAAFGLCLRPQQPKHELQPGPLPLSLFFFSAFDFFGGLSGLGALGAGGALLSAQH